MSTDHMRQHFIIQQPIFYCQVRRISETGQWFFLGLSGWKLCLATFKHLRNPYQLMLIPLTLWCGSEHSFLTTDYTAVRTLSICIERCSLFQHLIYNQAFITYPQGVAHVGYVMICYGDFIVSYYQQLIAVIADLWGLADAVWQTQVNCKI